MFIKKILRDSIDTKMFSVKFVKANGTERTMLCKLPKADKFYAGGELLGNREHLLEVIDVNLLKKNKDNPRKAWRSINLNTITSLKIGGIEWVE